jgi:hypothetical protein
VFFTSPFRTAEAEGCKTENFFPGRFIVNGISPVQQRTENLAGLITTCNRNTGVNWASGLLDEMPLFSTFGLYFGLVGGSGTRNWLGCRTIVCRARNAKLT